MNPTATTHDLNPWRLSESIASLQLGRFSAQVNLREPWLGVHQIAWNEQPLDGQFLAVSISPEGAQQQVTCNGHVRGNDMVVTYVETPERPYSLQVYWRAFLFAGEAIVLDSIFSLQTPFLESFPSITTETTCPGEELWSIQTAGNATALTEELRHGPLSGQHDVAPTAFLIRSAAELSYAEMEHPDTMSSWSTELAAQNQLRMRRVMGGDFLEKGVIRCLRIRSAFLPPNRDAELAARCLEDFVAAAPPLTT